MFDFLTRAITQRILLSMFCVAALGFLIMTGVVIKDHFRSTDFALTVKLQDKLPKRFDSKLVMLVDLGSMEVQTILIVIAILVVPLPKKFKGLLFIAYVAGLAVTLLGKNFLPQPAPAFLLQRGTTGFSFPSSHVQVDASYPSGHTYRVMFLSSLLISGWLVSKKRNLLGLAIAVGTTGLSLLLMAGLIVLGKHWTSDVIGGLFLATTLTSGVLYLYARTKTTGRNE